MSEVEDACKRSTELRETLWALLLRHKYPDDIKSKLLEGYVATALEHHEAIVLLIQSNLAGSAFALVRPVHETMVRAFWINGVADDKQIEGAWHDKNVFPCMAQMLAAIKPRYFGDTPSDSATEFFQALKEPWRAMCSYTHSGALQLGRRFTNDVVKPKYPEGEVLEVLNSTITKVTLLVLMFFISMQRYPEADETRRLLLEYDGA
jgi:hypothetical protein